MYATGTFAETELWVDDHGEKKHLTPIKRMGLVRKHRIKLYDIWLMSDFYYL